MPIHLIESNRSTILLQTMAEYLGAPRLFETQHVIVPGRHWFSLVKEVLIQRYGAFFQVKIQTFDAFVAEVLKIHAPQKTFANPDNLAITIFLHLTQTNILQEPVFSSLHTYLLQGGYEIDRNVTWQVSRHLGELFVRYAMQHPELTMLWRAGKRATSSTLEAWQKELFLRVTEDPQKNTNQPVLAVEWICEHLQPCDVAMQLHVVIPPDIVTAELWLYSWLAETSDVFCYFPTPSREFFEQVRRRNFLQQLGDNHPLLDAWGALLAHSVAQVHEFSNYDSAMLFEEPSTNTTLGRLQVGILENQPTISESLDESLRIWRFFSRKHECATIRQDIEHKLQQDPTLSFTDFAIIVPPADENKTSVQEEIEHVFSQKPILPIHQVYQPMDSENRIMQTVQALLRLPLLDGSAFAVLEFVLHPLVTNFTSEEMSWVRRFVQTSAVVRFWRTDDATTLDSSAQQHTWDEAFVRLALGAATPITPLLLKFAHHDDLGVSPLYLTADQWPVLIRFLTITQGLRTFCEACQSTRSMAQWATFLAEYILLFVHPVTQKDEKMLDRVLEILRQQGELEIWNQFDARLSFADVHAVLSRFLLRLQVTHSFADGRGIFVGLLQDALWLPFSHVYVVGLEENVIAYHREPSSLDVCALNDIPGREPSAREIELTGCLAVLCGTSKSVTFSWCARDPVTGDAVAPNVVIRDLLTVINVSENDVVEPDTTRIPMLRELQYASYIADLGANWPRNRTELETWPETVRTFWKMPEPLAFASPVVREQSISWRRLVSFWHFPLQTAALNWFATDEETVDELQEWEPETLRFGEIRKWIWDAFINAMRDPSLSMQEHLVRRFQTAAACGQAPTGVFSSLALNVLQDNAQNIFNQIQTLNVDIHDDWTMPAVGMDPEFFSHVFPALHLQPAHRRLVGILPVVSFHSGILLIDFYASVPEVRHVLEAFVATLAVCALRNMEMLPNLQVVALFSSQNASSVWKFPAFSQQTALTTLVHLADVSQQPSMMVPMTAEMALDFLQNTDKYASFDTWYHNEIAAVLIDEKNQKPKMKRNPVHNLEDLVDAQRAFEAASTLYLDPNQPLAQLFLHYIVPIIQTSDRKEEKNTKENEDGTMGKNN